MRMPRIDLRELIIFRFEYMRNQAVYYADDKHCPECRPEIADDKAGNQACGEVEHGDIDYYSKQAECQDNDRKSQQFYNRPDERINDAKDGSGEEKILPVTPENKAGNQPIGG